MLLWGLYVVYWCSRNVRYHISYLCISNILERKCLRGPAKQMFWVLCVANYFLLQIKENMGRYSHNTRYCHLLSLNLLILLLWMHIWVCPLPRHALYNARMHTNFVYFGYDTWQAQMHLSSNSIFCALQIAWSYSVELIELTEASKSGVWGYLFGTHVLWGVGGWRPNLHSHYSYLLTSHAPPSLFKKIQTHFFALIELVFSS